MGTGLLCRFLRGSPRLWPLACVLLTYCHPPDPVVADCADGFRQTCECASGGSGYQSCQAGRVEPICHCEGEGTLLDSGTSDGDGGQDESQGMDDEGMDKPDPTAAMCGEQSSEAKLSQVRPVDVIFVIDNSGSMSDEIKGVEENINENFARILNERGADYRVIMISDHGDSDSEQICIRAPLSGTDCNVIPAAPVNGPRFFHYDRNVQSTDAWCHLLDTFNTADQHDFAPTGWQQWLREDALKVFVVVSDDGIGCTWNGGTFSAQSTGNPVADAITLSNAFQAALLSLHPTQFGTALKPHYVWHSVIGVAAKSEPELPYVSAEPLQTSRCPTAVETANGYQMLSIGTGGLRFPVCGGAGFNSLFRAIAQQVVQGAGIDCNFPLPRPPAGKRLDLKSVVVEYQPGGGAKAQNLNMVTDDACTDAGFVVSGTDLTLCPQACNRVRGDAAAKLNVRFGCSADGIIF